MDWVPRFCAVTALALLPFSASCNSGTAPSSSEAKLVVTALVAAPGVTTVVVDVTAPDIPTALVFNIPVTAGVASGTITIPAGSNRTITMRAFDAGGVETHSGSITINIQPGTNPSISITLTPLTGNVPITVTLGSVKIAVTPATNTLSLAGTAQVQLVAAVTDAQGNPVTGTVTWASDNPGVVTVSATGLVTAAHVGQTNLLATFQGAAGSAAVTVTP
ncbi:MAG TPA: Ig-like domain-containing protein [bacterium]|nr:Ig-like domain-containing protein [bacterium]